MPVKTHANISQSSKELSRAASTPSRADMKLSKAEMSLGRQAMQMKCAAITKVCCALRLPTQISDTLRGPPERPCHHSPRRPPLVNLRHNLLGPVDAVRDGGDGGRNPSAGVILRQLPSCEDRGGDQQHALAAFVRIIIFAICSPMLELRPYDGRPRFFSNLSLQHYYRIDFA